MHFYTQVHKRRRNKKTFKPFLKAKNEKNAVIDLRINRYVVSNKNML